MGVHNQQRRAAKAKDRRQRRTPSAHERPGHPFWSWPDPSLLATGDAEPPMTEGERNAHDLTDAIVMLSAVNKPRAEISIRRLVARCVTSAQQMSITHRLSEVLVARIADAWSGGWRPLDLHNFVGRDLDTAAQSIAGDAMAAQLATYAATTLAESWPQQLRTIGASRWWPASRDLLTARADTDGFEPTLRKALEVVALLSMLPVIERLDPLPGTAHPRRPGTDGTDVDPRLLERVRRLLAQAESTPYEAEADTFTAAAQSLMTRHSLDAAMLAASDEGHADTAAPTRVWVERPYEQEKVRLLQAVSDVNRCRTVWSSGLGFATVVGHTADLAAVEAIFTSLLLQATRAMVGEGRQGAGAASRTRSFRRSFLTAYAARIGDRLRAATDAETESAIDEHETTTDPRGGDSSRALVRVLAERSAEVDAKVDELFPVLVSKPGQFTPDPRGWEAGRRAADSASLSRATSSLPGRRSRNE